MRVFETRYLDMMRTCLRGQIAFGVCLIERGHEVLRPGDPPATPHAVGTLARIIDWEAQEVGILGVVAEGGERFHIRRRWIAADGLQWAEIDLLPESPPEPVPPSCARLVPLLRELLGNLDEPTPPPYRFYDAGWVADRYAELLPLPPALAQQLLETASGGERLVRIREFIEHL